MGYKTNVEVKQALRKETEELKEQLESLKKAFDDIIYMAIRYAHSRHTYAPGVVRRACEIRTELGNFFLTKDDVIEKANTYEQDKRHSPYQGIILESDYLNDLFVLYEEKNNEKNN